jgi:hypothetical protein
VSESDDHTNSLLLLFAVSRMIGWLLGVSNPVTDSLVLFAQAMLVSLRRVALITHR